MDDLEVNLKSHGEIGKFTQHSLQIKILQKTNWFGIGSRVKKWMSMLMRTQPAHQPLKRMESPQAITARAEVAHLQGVTANPWTIHGFGICRQA